jgi:FlaG/FlaF family flagellin (archaellin)
MRYRFNISNKSNEGKDASLRIEMGNSKYNVRGAVGMHSRNGLNSATGLVARIVITSILAPLVLALVGGCGDTYVPSTNVDRESRAKDVFKQILALVESVFDDIEFENHDGTVVHGDEGSATVTGTRRSSRNTSADANRTSDSVVMEYTILFDGYSMYGLAIDGKADYLYSHSSTQQGTEYFSSDTLITISGDDIELRGRVRGFFEDEDRFGTRRPSPWDVSDRVSFSGHNVNDSDSEFRVSLESSGSEMRFSFTDNF